MKTKEEKCEAEEDRELSEGGKEQRGAERRCYKNFREEKGGVSRGGEGGEEKMEGNKKRGTKGGEDVKEDLEERSLEIKEEEEETWRREKRQEGGERREEEIQKTLKKGKTCGRGEERRTED